ncbi:MAG: Stp1/IreP family PP2C-type Ser/Thr phosphatase [Nitrospira defluvii]|nr:Stp1/IreP family PP2C-type Ser/Thr phosphatase [Nitrospira defluvii]
MHSLQVTHGASSDVGLTRRHNEDRFHADPSTGLFIVCDGMGGHRAGEVASSRAIEIIPSHLVEAAADPSLPLIGVARPEFSAATNRLASAVRLANHTVHQEAARHAEYSGMGTTVVAAWLVGPVLSIAHVGDSRLYLIRSNVLHPLTADHSLVQAQVQSGLLAADDAERVSHKHVLTRAVGVHATVEVELAELPVLDGDILLLCSDGLTAGVSADTILRAIHESPDPQTVSDRLIALSNAAGGTDNTTVIVATLTQSKPGMWNRICAHLFDAPPTDAY